MLLIDGIEPVIIGGHPNEHLYLRIDNDDPAFAPPGHAVVQAMLETEYDWWATRGARYQQEKDATADRVLGCLDQHLLGAKASVQMVDIATPPLTFWRSARSWRGAFEGWLPTSEAFKHVPKQLPGLDRFYMAGQWVEPGGGVPTAIMSGRHVVELVCAALRRPFAAPAARREAGSSREAVMMNILIVYATRQGQTEKIARRLATVLRERGDAPKLVDTNHPDGSLDLEHFQAALVCAPIHAGGYPRSIVRFARQHRAFLERGPSAFLSVGLAIASRTTDGRAETLPVVEKFVKRTGWRPARVELVAGALPYSKYNFFIRFIMRRIAAQAGGDVDTSRDYEYTDWGAVDRFASQFAADSIEDHGTHGALLERFISGANK